MRGSIIIPVLESYEIVKRQLLWMSSWMGKFSDHWNLILVDDGSKPNISIAPTKSHETRVIRILPHPEKWTQPRARNIGARACSESQLLFFTDIDHILTPDALSEADAFKGDMLRFHRQIGALDQNGKLLTEKDDLLDYGFDRSELRCRAAEHKATFVIQRSIHDLLKGFDEKFCGTYGPDDIDYSNRYEILSREGKCKPSEFSPSPVYVFPNPKDNRHGLFHSLLRNMK